MAGNSDKFKVKKPNLSRTGDSADALSSGAVATNVIDDLAEVESESSKPIEEERSVTTASEAKSTPSSSSSKPPRKTAPRNGGETAAIGARKNMIQAGYRIREEYIEALRLQSKKEERKIESVLDDILTSYFDSDERGGKFLESAHQILQIKSSY